MPSRYDDDDDDNDEVEAYDNDEGEDNDDGDEEEDANEQGDADEDEPEEAEGNDESDDVTDVTTLSPDQIKAIAEMVTQGLVAHMSNMHNDDEDEHLHPSQVHTDTTEDEEDEKNFIISLTTSEPNGTAHTIKGKVDTGASDNFMVEDVANILGLHVDRSAELDSYTVGSGESVEPVGIARLAYTINGKRYVEDFRVMQEELPHDVILGGPFLLHSHLISLNLPKTPPKGQKGFFLFERGSKKMSDKALNETREKRNAEREAAMQAHALAGR